MGDTLCCHWSCWSESNRRFRVHERGVLTSLNDSSPSLVPGECRQAGAGDIFNSICKFSGTQQKNVLFLSEIPQESELGGQINHNFGIC